jgi:FAD/FMN-containing dehydrogenase
MRGRSVRVCLLARCMTPLYSWGRYPNHPQTPAFCRWQSEVSELLQSVQRRGVDTLAFGNGRSYGDSCLARSDEVLHLRGLDRFISADWQSGVVRAECGVTLGELLRLAIPRGWFLPVTPGTKYVTLGGALANDVHGKNHHVRGTFGRHVRSFSLLRSDMEEHICSPEAHADLFAASIGGLGLTGVIRWVELQLMPIRGAAIRQTQVRFDSLEEFFALSNELDSQHEYTVAWVDCVAKGASTGRGVFIAGDHVNGGDLCADESAKLRVPFTPPISAMNSLTLKAFNSTYFHVHKAGRHVSRVGYEPFFYPLDRILEWNRIYGPRGFQQYQCVIPKAQARDGIGALLQAISAEGRGSFLAVLKRCGDISSPGLLSFPLEGVSLALDFSQHEVANVRLFQRLDALLRESGGRLYPAKDAHMCGEDFRRTYPAWEQVEALRDPALCSRFWQRVTSK